MTPAALLSEAVASLRLNLLRSALTAIGVTIGTAGIIVLGAASAGANRTIERQIAAFGTNALGVEAIKVENAAQRGPAVVLTDEDAAAIFEQVPSVRHMSREISGKVTLVAGNMRMTSQYRGVDASYADIADFKTSEGRFFSEDEVLSGSKVVVLGTTVAVKLFGRSSPIDQTLRMGGVPVQVIGVRTSLGSFLGQDMDSFIFVPVTTARSRLPQEGRVTGNQLSAIQLKASSEASRSAAKEAIRTLLNERKHVGSGARNMFEVADSTQFIELMNTTHSTLSSLLAATAAISLVAGGAGIMNIMLVSVTERTREIGLRRGIGARQRDILAQFLIEAVLLCAVAGIAGFALGTAGAFLVAKSSGWPLIVAPQNVALALAAAAGTGIIFGYLPAHRAAVLNPIDALRRE